MSSRLPDPPALNSLSEPDARAFRRWATELQRTLNLFLAGQGAANGQPFWDVSVSVYPSRTLTPAATLGDVRNGLGTLVLDLKRKGIVA